MGRAAKNPILGTGFPTRTASGSKLGSQLWLTKREALPGGAEAMRDTKRRMFVCVCLCRSGSGSGRRGGGREIRVNKNE